MADTSYLIANALRTIAGSDKRKQPTSAIIAAAGSSDRFGNGGGLSKQHQLIAGIPVLVRSLLAFEGCDFIGEIVVAAREGEVPLIESYRDEYGITKLKKIVPGGTTRQESVLRGFEATDPGAKYVAIHDGARCLVTVEMIEQVCIAAYRYRAAIAAAAVPDTVKIATKHSFIDSTTDRNLVWLAQTPQVFYATLYRAAAYSAREDGFSATDDSQLVERIQNPIRLVDCGWENIKITTPKDILLAEAILLAREKAQAPAGEVTL
ncbi:MAG TPA: 2-C-methyl-D-erythritol 4-phosphate cytidylyltransferase [Clostridiales bacterium]|nr:2-C-methyl-D-erythritol 4-phosphate cytidylyltransferase [Clostridiales bacterium]